MSAKQKLTLVSDGETKSGCSRSKAPAALPGRSQFRPGAVNDVHGWNAAVDDFLTHKSARCEPKTVQWYRDRLTLAKAWFSYEARNGTGVPLSDFRAKDMDQYLVHRISDTNANTGAPILASTRRADAVAIKAFIKWCRRERLIEINPIADYEVPRCDKPFIPTPKASTIAKVLTACQERWSITHNPAVRFLATDARSFYKRRNYAILAGLTAAGVRIGEMLALHVDDVDLDGRVLIVRKAKGNSWREVPFEEGWAEPLRAWLKVRPSCPSPLLFFTAYGEPIAYKQFLHSFRKDCAFAGVKGLTLHMLRHFSTDSVAKKSVKAASERAGHASVSITQAYLHPDVQHVREAVDAASPLREVLAVGNGRAVMVNKRSAANRKRRLV